jgi:quinolinate synthase
MSQPPLPSSASAAARERAERIDSLRRGLGPSLTILGHHYQNDRIVAHCDRCGDSLALARQVPGIDSENIVLCGVFFMGESAALMARPGQRVYLPEPEADCTMARMITGELLENVIEAISATGSAPTPLAYVNTSLDVKAAVGRRGGAVCTSANAGKMLAWALRKGERVLFVPDKNLGRNVGKDLGLREEEMCVLDIRRQGRQVDLQAASRAKLLLWPGLCSIHARFHPAHVEAARSSRPGCRVVTHPECAPDVVAGADATGSTAFIIDYVDNLPDNSAVGIGTEINQVLRLASRHKARGLDVFPLCPSACCNMAAVTPAKLENLLLGIRQGLARPVHIPAEAVEPARLTLTRMFEACA